MRRLKTVRRPPSTPRPQAISPVAPSPTPFHCPHAVHPCPSVDSGLGYLLNEGAEACFGYYYDSDNDLVTNRPPQLPFHCVYC